MCGGGGGGDRALYQGDLYQASPRQSVVNMVRIKHILIEMIITEKQEKDITKVIMVTDKKFALLAFVRTYKMIINVQTLGHTNV